MFDNNGSIVLILISVIIVIVITIAYLKYKQFTIDLNKLQDLIYTNTTKINNISSILDNITNYINNQNQSQNIYQNTDKKIDVNLSNDKSINIVRDSNGVSTKAVLIEKEEMLSPIMSEGENEITINADIDSDDSESDSNNDINNESDESRQVSDIHINDEMINGGGGESEEDRGEIVDNENDEVMVDDNLVNDILDGIPNIINEDDDNLMNLNEQIYMGEDVTVEDVTVEDVTVEDVTVEDVTVEDITVEDVTVEDVTVEDVTVEDVTVEDVTVEDVTVEDITVEDVTVEDVTGEISTNLGLEDNGGEIVSDIILGENEVINSVVNNITNNVIENNDNSKMDKSEILIFYMNKSVNELRDILKEKNLPTSGNKSKLISRIINN